MSHTCEEQEMQTEEDIEETSEPITGDRYIEIRAAEGVRFSVTDDVPTVSIDSIQGFEMSGVFDRDKNPLQALLNNFAND